MPLINNLQIHICIWLIEYAPFPYILMAAKLPGMQSSSSTCLVYSAPNFSDTTRAENL
jgi:hypothetical protein